MARLSAQRIFMFKTIQIHNFWPNVLLIYLLECKFLVSKVLCHSGYFSEDVLPSATSYGMLGWFCFSNIWTSEWQLHGIVVGCFSVSFVSFAHALKSWKSMRCWWGKQCPLPIPEIIGECSVGLVFIRSEHVIDGCWVAELVPTLGV